MTLLGLLTPYPGFTPIVRVIVSIKLCKLMFNMIFSSIKIIRIVCLLLGTAEIRYDREYYMIYRGPGFLVVE
jgi:hypothetical protein